MNSRRHLLTAASAVGALLALTACEKPTPLVTVVSGDKSVYTEASTWCFEEQTPPECSEREHRTPTLSVRGGETVGIDVGKELAESAWLLEFTQGGDGEPERPFEPQTGHYFSFTAPNLPRDSELVMTVRSLSGEGDTEGESTGEWRFRLTPAR